jgi:hypothetical protein
MIDRPVLFVWIPKTGGASLHYILSQPPVGMVSTANEPLERYREIFHNQGSVTFSHASIRCLVDEGVVSLDYLRSAFILTFIRNPWDRLVSLYVYWQKSGKVFLLRGEKAGDPLTFADFVDMVYAGPITDLGWYNSRGISAANGATKWFDSVESLDVGGFDFVGRFDNYEAEVRVLLRRLGLTKEGYTIRRLNQIPHNHYATYYTTRLSGMVGELYQEEIKRFGHKAPCLV